MGVATRFRHLGFRGFRLREFAPEDCGFWVSGLQGLRVYGLKISSSRLGVYYMVSRFRVWGSDAKS